MTEKMPILEKTLYIGQKEIENVSRNETVNLVGVLYKNGQNEDFTVEQYDNLVADDKYDDALVSIRKHEKMLKRMLKEMVDSRINIDDHSWVLEKLSTVIGDNYMKSIAKLYNISRPGLIMLADIDEVLKS